MPDHATPTRPNHEVPHPELHMTDGMLKWDDVAPRPDQPRWTRPWLMERNPGEPGGFGYSDLLEGGIAVAALLGMLSIGLTPWLAIPLSTVTYFAIALMRPSRERQNQTMDGVDAEPPHIEEMAETLAHTQHPETEITGTETIAARFGLTRREREVLPLLAQRLTDREIAERLSISHRTAMNHTANILGKLELASRRDVVALVGRHALLPPSVPPHDPE